VGPCSRRLVVVRIPVSGGLFSLTAVLLFAASVEPTIRYGLALSAYRGIKIPSSRKIELNH
jgi:hypothetical protein